MPELLVPLSFTLQSPDVGGVLARRNVADPVNVYFRRRAGGEFWAMTIVWPTSRTPGLNLRGPTTSFWPKFAITRLDWSWDADTAIGTYTVRVVRRHENGKLVVGSEAILGTVDRVLGAITPPLMTYTPSQLAPAIARDRQLHRAISFIAKLLFFQAQSELEYPWATVPSDSALFPMVSHQMQPGPFRRPDFGALDHDFYLQQHLVGTLLAPLEPFIVALFESARASYALPRYSDAHRRARSFFFRRSFPDLLRIARERFSDGRGSAGLPDYLSYGIAAPVNPRQALVQVASAEELPAVV